MKHFIYNLLIIFLGYLLLKIKFESSEMCFFGVVIIIIILLSDLLSFWGYVIWDELKNK